MQIEVDSLRGNQTYEVVFRAELRGIRFSEIPP